LVIREACDKVKKLGGIYIVGYFGCKITHVGVNS